MLSTSEVCTMLGVTTRTLRRWRRLEGNPIPFMVMGGKTVYDRADVKAWGYENADRIRNADPNE